MDTTGKPQPNRAASRSLVVVALFAALLAITTSCGTDSEPKAGSTSTVDRASSPQSTTSTDGTPVTTTDVVGSSSTDPSTVGDPEHQTVIDAYVGYWDARLAANTGTPNPQDPSLALFATGNQLTAVIAETQKNLDEGRAFQVAPNPADVRRVKVVSVEGDVAEVQECFVDDTQVIDRSTGGVLNDAVSTQSVLGHLRLVDGTWRVSGSELVQRWEGVAGCALAS